MPRQRKPETAEREQRTLMALASLANGEWATPYEAAKNTGSSARTVSQRWEGGMSRIEARESQQKLTGAEEKVLVDWINHLTATGHLATYNFIKEMAEEIRHKRSREIQTHSEIPLGQSWVLQFLKRFPYLQTCISRSIEASRVKDVMKEVVVGFFDVLHKCINEYQILSENIYNMNETDNSSHTELIVGFTIEETQTTFVVVDSKL